LTALTKPNKIYVAVKHDIFDVTDAKFYKKGASYNIFAGRESSTALARNSFEESDLATDYVTIQLNEEEEISLNEWYKTFAGKYKIVGKIVNKEKEGYATWYSFSNVFLIRISHFSFEKTILQFT
jgi:predicted heme/steroid binding protein